MAERLTERVNRYCEANEIAVPLGFHRHPASRYAIILLSRPPKLVARTWFKQADVVYYLQNIAGETTYRILDFKDGIELTYNGGKRLVRSGPFEVV